MNKNKVAIYGGSFDPPHNGHTFVIDKLAEIFDKVLVVPAFISPFKTSGGSASALDRLQMLKLALKSVDRVQICDYEIQKGDISYTIDTVKHLKSLYKDSDFYVVIGAENKAKLHFWKDYNALNELITFYAVQRLGYDNPPHGNIVIAPFFGPDISSSHCKLALSLNRADSLMDSNVIEYIEKNGLYKQYNPFVSSYKMFGLSEKRVEHSYLSALYGIYLAKLYDVDVEKVVTALLLHDIAKAIANTDSAKPFICDQTSLDSLPPSVQHSELGAQIASNNFGINDSDIINAIRYHTTARPGMSKLEEIVFLADKLESSRTYYGVDQIRAAAKRSLSEAMVTAISATIEKLTKTNRDVSKITIEALEYYKYIRSKNGNKE